MGLSFSEKAALRDQFFAKVLLLGDVKLYYHVNRSNHISPVRFFIQKGDEPTFQLIKTSKIEKIDGVEYRRVSEAYRDQLKKLFSDCPSVVVDTRKDYYKQKVMLELVSQYVSCKKLNSSYKEVITYHKPWFSAMGGMGFTSLSIDPQGTPTYGVTDYEPYPRKGNSSSPIFGIQFGIDLDKRKKASFISDLFYIQMNANGKFSGTPTVFQTADGTSKIVRNTLRLFPGVQRNLRLGKNFQAHLQIGLTFSLVMSSLYDVTVVTTNTGTGTSFTTSYSIAEHFRKSEIGFFGGVMFTYRKAGLITRFEPTTNFSADDHLSITSQNFYFGLNYRFTN